MPEKKIKLQKKKNPASVANPLIIHSANVMVINTKYYLYNEVKIRETRQKIPTEIF